MIIFPKWGELCLNCLFDAASNAQKLLKIHKLFRKTSKKVGSLARETWAISTEYRRKVRAHLQLQRAHKGRWRLD